MPKDINKITTAYTHASVFHADDVFSAALLTTINPAIDIQRVMSVDNIEDTENVIIFDIGGGEYDHHQKDKALRATSDYSYIDRSNNEVKAIPYCAFGLLWRDYGELLCPNPKAWKKVDRDLVLPIDKADNGIYNSTLASAIGQFNPAWNNKTVSQDDCFTLAQCSAEAILHSYIDRANAEAEAETAVLESEVIDNKILVLQQYMPWQSVVVEQMPEILYVVFPSQRGGYNVQTVPASSGSFTPRKGFPTEWLGNPDESLGMYFCHTGNFLLSCHEQDQAIRCAQIAAGKDEK
jgi:uncharacterized UPF0160 family protein